MKHILFIMPALLGGGAEKVLIDILKNFDYSRYQVTLLLEQYTGVYLQDIPSEVSVKYVVENGIWIERGFRIARASVLAWTILSVLYGCYLRWKLRKEHYYAIVSFMEGAAVQMHSHLMKKALKHISWVHIDLKQKHWSLDFFKSQREEYETYSKMNQIVFVSKDARLAFLQLYSNLGDKCSVIYNLIDRKKICEKIPFPREHCSACVISMVGRLNRQKRYDRAIEVARLLEQSGIDFILQIIGEGELQREIEDLIAKYGLERKVLLLGFVKPPYSMMASSDIFLNTSETEGYPLVLCEALCLGLPIVATRITGSKEILDENKYGLLVDENIQSIYEGICLMLLNPSIREQYQLRAKKRSEEFSVEKVMTQIYNLL